MIAGVDNSHLRVRYRSSRYLFGHSRVCHNVILSQGRASEKRAIWAFRSATVKWLFKVKY